MKRALPAILLVPVIAGSVIVFLWVGRWLSAPDRVHRVDAIVVLSGDPDRRVPQALRLVERGVSADIWVVRWNPGDVVSEERSIRDYVAKRTNGSGRPNLAFLPVSRSVLDEARVVRRFALSHDVGSIGVIAPPSQAARVRLAFGRSLPDTDVSVWRDGSRYDAARWWRTHRGTTLSEAAKTGGTLALLGPLPEARGDRPPAALPLRALAGAFVIAVVVGAACRRIAHRLGLVAMPRLWRAHAVPTPMLGGLAILAGIGAGGLAAGGVRATGVGAVAAAGVVVLGLVGFVDDVAGLGARTRLAWAAVAGSAAWLLGLRVDLFANATGGEFVDGALTLFWFVGVTHALNLLDHIDGATAGVGAASAATVAAVAVAGGQFVVAAAAAAVAGACLGYLVHNFPPARLFMGDMGALALGFALAALALGLKPDQRIPLSAFVPVLALGVPIFDTTLVSISRVRAGRGPLVGGTDHMSHRLRARGLSVRAVVGVLVGVQVVLGAAAYGVAVAPRGLAWALVAVTAAATLGALAFFLRLPEWTPPTHEVLSGDVRLALARALDAIAMFEEAAAVSGLAGVDPATMRALREGARRLDAIQERVAPASGPEPSLG